MSMPRLIAAAALTLAGAAHAQIVVFTDNFDANALGLNTTPSGWVVSGGTVDIIGNPGFYDFLPGNGRYVDMDGSTGNAGKMSIQLNLTGGLLHTLSFDLAGNRRNGGQERVDVSIGTMSSSHSLPQNAGFTAYSLQFTPGSTGAYTLSFEGAGGDNIGMLLDRVQVTAVPEPQTWALLGLGLAAVGGIARRRRAA
ncbi:MAG: PEP-CTERM sorting domain-containing protein [Aquabacterium sp.]